MSSQIAIITHSFLDPAKPIELNIGGVETWLHELTKLLLLLGLNPIIYQTAKQDFKIHLNGIEIIGLGGLDRNEMSRLSHLDIDRKKIKWIIYASSFVAEKHFKTGQIFIQHGIHWDYTTSREDIWLRLKWEYIRWKLSRHDLLLCKKSRLTITVDTNFLNYSRIMLRHAFSPDKMRYIPNFAIPQDKLVWQKKWQNPEVIHIIFARRFESRRGVILFSEAIEQILKTEPNIHVTFAGCGSFDNYVKEKFGSVTNVTIEIIPHEKMYDILNKTHIAVIPTTYSEGTSLSCLEAMASGCAVIATDVGGLANLIIPDYNGLLVRPIVKDIKTSIIRLIHNQQLAETLANRAFNMVGTSFSLSIWETRIQHALREIGVLKSNN